MIPFLTSIIACMASTKRGTSTKRSTPKPAPRKAIAPSRRKVPKPVTPVVNEAMRTRYASHLAAFKRAHGAEVAQWDAAYESLAPILQSDPPLYLAGGFKSARAFVAAELPGMDLDTVRDYVRVATHFEPDDEKKHGVTKLALLLDYLEVINGGALPKARINPDRTKVTVGDDSARFAEMTFDAMRDAVRRAKGASGARRKEKPEVRAMRALFGKHGLGNVTVAHAGDRWSLGRIEARQFKDLAAALTRAARGLSDET